MINIKAEISKEPSDENEVIERYIILFLGAIDSPIPSILHLEKEMFIFSNFNPKIKKFLTFVKHYKGPYSQEIKELIENPHHFHSAWIIENNKISLTKKGKQIFRKIVEMYEEDPKFRRMLEAIRLIRRLYDKLSIDEFLLLVYITYPEYKERSKVLERIYRKRKEIAHSLLRKSLITTEKFQEIIRWII